MSDLQCAATLLVVGPDAPDDVDLGPAVALIYACPSTRNRALTLAAALDTAVRDDAHLEASTGDGVVQVFEEIADLHRGETVAVLPAATPPRCASDGLTRVRIDGDGWLRG